mmetsp:Transcript_30198/g.54688  ORF Transcript_30198/g.54688 Transcript_30198/m.54688 type:complete len:280 (-) Transcript_30198:153-992(-)
MSNRGAFSSFDFVASSNIISSSLSFCQSIHIHHWLHREILTSSAENPNNTGPEGGGVLTVRCVRQLKQQAERRNSGVQINYSNQPADDLSETPSSSVDIVISLQAAQRMAENGLDWKRSIREAGRVLKPGGRFLFVESSEVDKSDGTGSESYLDYLVGLSDLSTEIKPGVQSDGSEEDGEIAAKEEDSMSGEDSPAAIVPIFEEVGYDQVDMVLRPHIAGVAFKAMDADMTVTQKAGMKSQEESDRYADLSLNAFERGSKRRRRKKKTSETGTGMGGGE